MKNYTLGCIICTKDRPDDILRLLKALTEQYRQPNEVIIVDASFEDTLEDVLYVQKDTGHTQFPFRLVYIHSEPGLTKQRNIGVKASKADILVFLDDDTLPDRFYLSYLEKVFEEDEGHEIGGAMGRITEERGSKWDTFLRKLAIYYARLFLLTRPGVGRIQISGFPTHPFLNNSSKGRLDVEVLSGANMAYRRQVFEQGYWFDEWFSSYSYMEDVDFSYRVSRCWRLVYEPKALIRHLVSPSARLRRREKKKNAYC